MHFLCRLDIHFWSAARRIELPGDWVGDVFAKRCSRCPATKIWSHDLTLRHK